MPIVSPAPWVPARYFDDDGDPLAGGRLYAYKAGTSTPQSTYHDPAGTVVQTHPVLLDDAGYAPVYLLAGLSYKLRLHDAQDVLQWEVDAVTASGGAGQGGIFSTAPLVLSAVPGPNPLVAPAAFQPGWRQVGVTADVTVAFGQSANLAQLAIGDVETFDRWGYCGVALADRTTAANFQTGDLPWTTTPSDVRVTPIGGAFDSQGQIALTLWYQTLGLPIPDQPTTPPVPSTGGFYMTSPITVLVVPGPAPLVAADVWQPGWQQLGVLCEVTQAFDAVSGLTGLAIGDVDQFDRWGVCGITLGATTTAANFRTSTSPWTTTPSAVLITPLGGAFAATGQVRLVLHYLTLM